MPVFEDEMSAKVKKMLGLGDRVQEDAFIASSRTEATLKVLMRIKNYIESLPEQELGGAFFLVLEDGSRQVMFGGDPAEVGLHIMQALTELVDTIEEKERENQA